MESALLAAPASSACGGCPMRRAPGRRPVSAAHSTAVEQTPSRLCCTYARSRPAACCCRAQLLPIARAATTELPATAAVVAAAAAARQGQPYVMGCCLQPGQDRREQQPDRIASSSIRAASRVGNMCRPAELPSSRPFELLPANVPQGSACSYPLP